MSRESRLLWEKKIGKLVCKNAQTAIIQKQQQQKPYHEMCTRQTYEEQYTQTKTHTQTFKASTLSSFFKTAKFYCSLIANDSVRLFSTATHPVTTESIRKSWQIQMPLKWINGCKYTHTQHKPWMCFVSRFCMT